MLQDNRISAHKPHVVVPNECAASCKRLQSRIDAASLDSIRDPNEQMAVVCCKLSKLVCNAAVVHEGQYNTDFGEAVEGSDEYFLVNPFYHNNGSTVPDMLEKAKAQGAVEQDII